MTDDYIQEEELRARVEKKLNDRQEVYGHFSAYVVVNLILWAIYIVSGAGGFPWPAMATFGWGIGMYAHWADYYYTHGRGATYRAELVEHELARERERLGMQKSKRLADDRESVYGQDDDQPRGLYSG